MLAFILFLILIMMGGTSYGSARPSGRYRGEPGPDVSWRTLAITYVAGVVLITLLKALW